ncbi:DNA-binding protein inhibitor ID-2-like [Alosa pseudoharengus]|uniref:DNA-binding protein inhibitor ID-2-like n=1 Tax=Alosa pseudoharengus TaxID=34774 RepID=UPI003F89666F
MKAISPVTSLRKSTTTTRLSDHSAAISRNKTTVDDALSLLYNMNDCYTKLKELVPSLPQNRSVSKMEILQHVIDYILDLQIALDSSSALVSRQQKPQQHHQRQEMPTISSPLTTMNTEVSIISIQSKELSTEVTTDESRALFR